MNLSTTTYLHKSSDPATITSLPTNYNKVNLEFLPCQWEYIRKQGWEKKTSIY